MLPASLQPVDPKSGSPISKLSQNSGHGWIGKAKIIIKWCLTGLPLIGIAWASLITLQVWLQQLLILFTLLWFYVFFLLDTFFLGG